MRMNTPLMESRPILEQHLTSVLVFELALLSREAPKTYGTASAHVP